jgi:hypothetical protein
LREYCDEITFLRLVHDLGPSGTAKFLGRPERGVYFRIKGLKARNGGELPPRPPEIELPDFPSEDISAEDIIALQTKRYEARKSSHDAHTWFPVTVNDDKPIGILWFGDPHLDDNGCNWPALKRHTDICRTTPGLYGVNIGDTTNCWGGRLIRKYADQDTSAKTARRLAEWFLLNSGVSWLIWLYGNHEHMGDGSHVLGEMAKRYGTTAIVMHDWEARFVVKFPNGENFKIFAAHDFPGNSMWNPLHGHVKAARFANGIDLCVAGHKHNWGISQWELAEQATAPLMVRCRGYKHMDDFARRIGANEQEEGQAVLTIFNPNASCRAGRIQAFVDVDAGADYLTFLRRQNDTSSSIRYPQGTTKDTSRRTRHQSSSRKPSGRKGLARVVR